MPNLERLKAIFKGNRFDLEKQRIEEIEERFRTIFDQAIDSVVIIDLDTNLIVDFNENAYKHLGYTREEFSRLRIFDIDKVSTVDEIKKRRDEASINKNTVIFETRHKTKSGELQDVQVSFKVISIKNKSFSMAVWRNITEYKKAQERLKESEEKYHAIFNQAVDSILITDFDTGEIIDFNRHTHENLGYTREEFARLKIGDLDPSFRKDKERTNQFHQKGFNTFLTKLKTKSGDFRDIQVNIQSIHIGGKNMLMNIWHDVTEQNQAQSALLESEEKFSKAFNSASDAMAVFSSDNGGFMVVNENYIKLSGYSREELIGHNADDLQMWGRPEDREKFLDTFAKKGRTSGFEFLFRIKSGETRTCLMSAESMIVGGEKCLIAVVRDITEQKAAEQALRESEEKFYKAFSTSANAICITRLSDRKIVDVNESYTSFNGYTREEVVGHTGEEFNYWADKTEETFFRDLIRKEGKFRNFEVHSRHKSGEIRVGLASAEVINIGGVPHRIVTIQDITERKQAEQRLWQASKEWQATFDSINDLVSIQDNDFRLIRVNQAYAKAVGMDREALVGRFCYEAVHHANCAVVNCPHQETLKTKKAVTREIFEPGLGVYLQVSTSPIFNESGYLIGTVHIAKDITERKEAEEALRESEKKFVLAFNTSPTIMSISTLDGIFLEVNDNFLKKVCLPRDRVIGRTANDLNLWVNRDDDNRMKQKIKENSSFINEEYQFRNSSGEIETVLFSAAGINIGGKPCLIAASQDITERKKMEKDLRESEEKFSTVFSTSPNAICIASLEDDKFLEINESFCRHAGYSREEVLGHTPRELKIADENDLQQFESLIKKDGKFHNLELHTRTKSGERRVGLSSAEIISIGGKQCRIVVVTDITELKKAEEALRDSEEKFSKAFSATPAAVCITSSKDNRFIEVNESFYRLTGFSRDEVIGRTGDELNFWIDENEKKKIFDELLTTGRVSYEEFRSRRKSGEIGTLLISMESLTIRGEPCYMAVIDDITERKKANEALRDSEEKFSKAFSASPLAVAITRNEDRRFIDINESFSRITGYSYDDIVGHSPDELNFWVDEEEKQEFYRELKEKGTVYNAEFKSHTKSGETRTLLASIETLTIQGEPCRMMVLADITERKKMEEALRESEEKFSTAFRATPIAICITSNRDNRFIEANESFSRFTGYSLDDVIGHSATDLNLWVDEDERLKFYGELFEKGMVYNAEFRTRMKSGEIRTILASGENLTIHGEPCRMLVTVDITERKKAEEALADSEKKLRIMFDSVTDGITVADLNGKISGINRRVLEMHGFSNISELVNQNALDFIIPKERQQASEDITRNLKERKTTSLEHTLLRKDGSTFLGEINVSLLNDSAGIPIGYIAVTRDITQRKQIENALKESETKYATLIESSNDGIVIIQDAKIKFSNSMMQQISGFSAKESMDQFITEFIPAKYHSVLAERYRRRTEGQPPPSSYEIEICTKDGRLIPVDISVSLIEYNGRPAEMAVIRDISERKQAEDQLQEAYLKETEMRKELEVEMKRRAEFTRALVHELKTPVTPILASSDGLLEILEEEPAKSLAANINRGAYNLNKRIDELLDVARSELNILKITLAPVNIRPILKEVAAEMSVVAKKKAQAITLEVPRVIPKVNADYSRIKQVVDNLVTNAVKYTQKGSKIIIGAKERQGKLIVEVRDNGAGLNEEEIKRIFEPYYHKDSNNHQLSGLGLGLSLCKKFIELHGGEIWAESKPGKGSVFAFSLPITPRKTGTKDAL